MRLIALALALASTSVFSACELTEVTVANTEDVVVAELTLRTDATVQRAILHRTLRGTDSVAALVPNAKITVTDSKGRVLTFTAASDQACIDNTRVENGPPLGSCYTGDTRPGRYSILPGETYTLSITLNAGGVLTGVTHVPTDIKMLRPTVTPCALAANDTITLSWTRSPDVWVYASETLIRGLKPILEAQGKEADDPLRLFGLSASAADTTIVFPTEFGVFQRFDVDKSDALLAIAHGLPAGVTADITIAAADRNYVNWERGGDFNPSGSIRIPSIRGAGTGVFSSLVPHKYQIRAGATDIPGC